MKCENTITKSDIITYYQFFCYFFVHYLNQRHVRFAQNVFFEHILCIFPPVPL